MVIGYINHKMSISYHKNGLVSSHLLLEDGLFFMWFVVRIFWRNQLTVNNLLVSVSRWDSWMEAFRFHVNCIHFRGPNFVQGARHNCVGKLCFILHVQCCGRCRTFDTAVHLCDCMHSGVEVPPVNNNASSYLTIFISLFWVW